MNRRLLVTSLAVLGVAGPALSQTPTSKLGDAEMEHAKKTAMAGAANLQASDVALQKASHAKVKEFAKFEHDEQTTVAEVLMSMDPSMGPPMLDPKMAEMLTKLKGMSGAAFDRMYVAGQIAGHEMLLTIQEDYLKDGKDMPTIAVTKLVLGMVKEHLALLADLHKTLG